MAAQQNPVKTEEEERAWLGRVGRCEDVDCLVGLVEGEDPGVNWRQEVLMWLNKRNRIDVG